MIPGQVNGSLVEEDWQRIIHALKSYVIREEETLKTQNVGDREWQELISYSSLAADIELFILPLKCQTKTSNVSGTM